jgi:UDP-4-amino-4,6-dideoxy-N-acetyl-beta-L-altrosamine transaminase
MNKLAIEGGLPVRRELLPYGRQSIDADDVQAVVQALTSDWLTTGPKVIEFERLFAQAIGAQHAVAVSSGTSALHASVAAAGVGPGDEVITTPLTFVATANCVRYVGANVVFADVRSDSLNIDPSSIEQWLTPRTKAIIAVDYAGLPADMAEINAIADRHSLTVIEDAAHSLGALYAGRRTGSIAGLTTFSLHPVKHITTGEGGMVTTDDEVLAQRVRIFRNHGINTDFRQRAAQGSWLYEMDSLGWNYRLTDIQCALGMAQLSHLDAWVERRRHIAARYTAAFREMEELTPPSSLPDRLSSWHLYVFRLNLERLRVGRHAIFQALRAENIGVNVHYIPVPWQPYYQRLGYSKGQWPVAESAYERMISLPIFPAMKDRDVEDVISAVIKVIKHFRK